MGVLTGCILRQFLSISASIIPLNLHAGVKWVSGSCSSDKENNCSKIIQLINNYPSTIIQVPNFLLHPHMKKRNPILGISLDPLEGKASTVSLLAKRQFPSPVTSNSKLCCRYTNLKDILNLSIHHPIHCNMD